MRRLTFRGWRARARDERGAVGVMVALMLVPLLGCAAIAIDVSALRSEQQQLRNGADAAALAIATDCAWNPSTCGGDTAATASSLVVRNAGQVGATTPTSTVAVAPADPFGQTVTVTATARQNHWFAPVLGHDSSTVAATSTAAWSGMSRATAQLPLAIARCEYDKHRTRPAVNMEASNSGCTGDGQTTLRFVWLNTDSGSVCRTTTQVGAQVTRSSAGATRMPNACEGKADHLFGLAGKTVLLPVIEAVGGVDRVYGFAAFHVSGYDLGGDKPWSQMTPREKFWAVIEFLIRLFTGTEASPKGLGIDGHFTTHVELSDAPRPTSAPDLGARSVFLTER
ncbi:pilus assembly protein TadG-related protein [Candidatus Blastococcus massiliensis]|uniref:pilus assembly protein TadG-related protein n=1 Tax=Candidatus Blastococcus massiliensis TaxID=1470358 RepID=UPI000688EAB3|nr:pilus assembly protein TadG-related protein [Candidatus Blastococcus massiliensis]